MIHIILMVILLIGGTYTPMEGNISTECTIEVLDAIYTYNTSDIVDLQLFLNRSTVNDNIYHYNNSGHADYTCVNFTNDLITELKMCGFEASITRVGNIGGLTDHAIVSVRINNEIIFIEPQTDEIVKLSELVQVYKYEQVIIFDLIAESIVFDIDGWLSEELKQQFME